MKKLAIALDIGGTNLRAALVNGRKIEKIVTRKTPSSKEQLLQSIVSMINELNNVNVNNIGISVPGPLKNGVIKNPPNIALRNFNLKAFIEKRFKKIVEIENDAKCAALAELHYGVKKKNFILLTIGTGIGGGIVINGEIFNREDYGGELGGIYLSENKSFEDLASGKRILLESKRRLGRELNLSELILLNDKRAIKVVEEISEKMAQGIGSLINIFNPECVVIAGSVRKAGDNYFNIVRKKIKRYIILPSEYKIVLSKLEHPSLIGATLLTQK